MFKKGILKNLVQPQRLNGYILNADLRINFVILNFKAKIHLSFTVLLAMVTTPFVQVIKHHDDYTDNCCNTL